MKRFLLPFIVAAVISSGCASRAPVPLPDGGEPLVRAREAAVAVGSIQRVAIDLNAVTVCPMPPCPPNPTHPLLSDANTRAVVDVATDVLTTLRATPGGWQALTDAGLVRLSQRLDAAGLTRLKPYLDAARLIIAAQ